MLANLADFDICKTLPNRELGQLDQPGQLLLRCSVARPDWNWWASKTRPHPTKMQNDWIWSMFANLADFDACKTLRNRELGQLDQPGQLLL